MVLPTASGPIRRRIAVPKRGSDFNVYCGFNVENFFARPHAFNGASWADGRPIVNAAAEFNTLIAAAHYTPAAKQRMVELLTQLDVYRVRNGLVKQNRSRSRRWAWLRKKHGSFDVDRKASAIEITASGRSNWIGWVELATEPTDETATRMTARVIHDLDADIIGVVEAENRPSLVRFNDDLLGGMYDKIMLVDGNDRRGIDVGIIVKANWNIASIPSHVDDIDNATGRHSSAGTVRTTSACETTASPSTC